MNRKLCLYLVDDYIGELTIGSVRGRETWMFRYDDAYIDESRPMIDPSISNSRGPQFPQGGGMFGFLSDASPDRWRATNAISAAISVPSTRMTRSRYWGSTPPGR